MMVGSNLTPEQLQQIVDKTILALDKDQDGKINFDEFCAIVNKGGLGVEENDVASSLTIEVPKV